MYQYNKNAMEYNKAVNTCPEPKGVLLIIGGKEDKGEELKQKQEEENKSKEDESHPEETGRSEVLKSFIKLTGKESPAIEIITSASSEGEEMFATYKKVFEELQVNNIGHIHH